MRSLQKSARVRRWHALSRGDQSLASFEKAATLPGLSASATQLRPCAMHSRVRVLPRYLGDGTIEWIIQPQNEPCVASLSDAKTISPLAPTPAANAPPPTRHCSAPRSSTDLVRNYTAPSSGAHRPTSGQPPPGTPPLEHGGPLPPIPLKAQVARLIRGHLKPQLNIKPAPRSKRLPCTLL
jgi:hypothetical protein